MSCCQWSHTWIVGHIMGTLVGSGTRLFIGEKGQRTGATTKKGANWVGHWGEKWTAAFSSASIFCTRNSPFLPTKEPRFSQYLNKQRSCTRCLNGPVGNVTRPFTYLPFPIRTSSVPPQNRFPMFFFSCFFFFWLLFLFHLLNGFLCRKKPRLEKKSRKILISWKSWQIDFFHVLFIDSCLVDKKT